MYSIKLKSVFFALSMLLSMIAPCMAFEFHVTTAQELQSALSTAAANGTDDTVFLSAGTYFGNFRFRTDEAHSLTVEAEDGLTAEDVVLDGGQTAYVFMFDADVFEAPFHLERIAIRNGKSTTGGGIYAITKGKVDIRKCIIENNSATSGTGGGVHIKDASAAVFEENAIKDNFSDRDGGGIYIFSCPSLTFTLNNISKNYSDGHGGGIYISGGTTAIFDSNLISENQASTGEGGARIRASDIRFANNTVTGNQSGGYGGGLSLEGAYAEFISNTVAGNSSTGSGGGIYSSIQNSKFTDNQITDNHTSIGGGGIWIKHENFSAFTTLDGNYIANNSSIGSGGGARIYFGNSSYHDSKVTLLSNELIANHSSVGEGGGLYINSKYISLTSNSVNGNSSGGDGAGIYLDSCSATLKNNMVFQNRLTSTGKGGGLYIDGKYMQTDELFLINNSVTGNTSEGSAGGLFLKIPDREGTVHVYNNIIWGNLAAETADLYLEGYGAETNLFNNVMSEMAGIWHNQGYNQNGDPLFFDAENGDCHLTSASPCINAGTAAAPECPSTDLEGNPREGNPDIGALEFFTSDLHPADADNDWIIEQNEYDAYLTAWKNGDAWPSGPFPIPPAYVTRAGYLLFNGGAYRHIGANRPVCWTPGQ